MEDMRPGLERRKYLRVPVDLHIVYAVNAPAQVKMKIAGKEEAATMINISEGGMAFIADHELPETTKLDIRFHVQRRQGPSTVITCVGQVCYSFLLADYHRYHTGIEFVMIRDAQKRLIADFIRSNHHKGES